MDLKKWIRDVPDFPKEGIIFKDIAPLLQNAKAWNEVMNRMEKKCREHSIDKVAGIEARGFFLAGALADRLGCGLVLARKPGKLPYQTIREEYELEYGTNTMEMHTDAVSSGERVVVVDDLLATGGTAAAVIRLIEKLGARVPLVQFIVELEFLHGRKRIPGVEIHSLIAY